MAAHYTSWAAAGGWDTEVPSGIPSNIWHGLGKQKYRIECQYRKQGRSWSSFIRDMPDDVKESLCNDVTQWTRDYSDHMGTTDSVKNMVAFNYCRYIPLKSTGDKQEPDLPAAKNDVFAFIIRSKGNSLVAANVKNDLIREYNLTDMAASDIVEWIETLVVDMSKLKELISFAIHTNIFKIRHSKVYEKPKRTREGGTVKLRSSNASRAEQAFKNLKQ